MDIRQLSALIAVAEGGSFSAAARALHTVQSNISTHIARLERDLGATLVDRASGHLTDEGRIVVDRARHIQGELAAIEADLASLHDVIAGSVRFGCIGTVGRWLAPLVLERVTAEYPLIHLVIVDATTTSLVPQLLSDNLDLAVVNLPLAEPELGSEDLFEEDRLVIAPTDHPLARLDSVTLHDLGDHPLLLEPRGTAFRDELDALAAAAGVELRPQAEVDGLRLITSLTFQGFGASIIPATAAPPWMTGDWVRVPVKDLARRRVGLAQRRRRLPSAPMRAVHDLVVRVVAEEATGLDGVHPLGGEH
jgi:LysR family hydrogen peroxide-inducible transcriptional activator